CELATEILEGAYIVRCQLGDTESQLNVEVKRYVLPKIQFTVKPDRPWYVPGDKVKVAIEAKYFHGQPVAGGEVVAHVGLGPDAKPSDHRLRTDFEGKAELVIDLPQRFLGQPDPLPGDLTVAVNLALTDTAGQKAAKRLSLKVSGSPMKLE